MKINADIGPAFLAIVGQSVAAIVLGTLVYSELKNTTSNNVIATEKLAVRVEKQDTIQRDLGDRLIRVETTVTGVAATIANMDRKLDDLKSK